MTHLQIMVIIPVMHLRLGGVPFSADEKAQAFQQARDPI